ncbi:hypothetical protein OAG1_41300 [Agarivorans sp. OAG1]|uniref:hypothetical protein n=1 Tax=Agarivorans sp. OAG1 TaxID=3082387 RepID=UPI002B2B932E|nr:hypothetical protein OAG1_41300 [Agarivorans sp. OAG1]
MRRLSTLAVLCTTSLLYACGGSSDSGTPDPAPAPGPTTAFSISVDAPPSLVTVSTGGFSLFSKAYADSVDNLEKDNFAVAIIDADGNVIETVELADDQWSREPDGTYVITLPGGERLDCVVLIDLDGTPALQLNQPLPSDNLFAPTTSEEFQVDLSSTAAYRAVVEQIAAASTSASDWGEFASAVPSGDELASNVDIAQQLVASVIEEVREEINQAIIDSGNDFTLEDILEDPAILELADNVVDRIETETEAADTNVAEVLQQGVWWVYADKYDGDLEFEAGKMSFDGVTTSEQVYLWDVSGGEALDLSTPEESYSGTIDNVDTTQYDVDRWILGSEGWLEDFDMPLFRSATETTAVLTNAGLQSDTSLDREASLKQIDLAGSSVRAFAATEDASELLLLIPSSATFSEGATAYLGSETLAEDRYRIFNWGCDDQEGEFCNRIYRNMGGGAEESAPTVLSALFSAEPAEANDYSMQGVWMTPTQSGNASVLAEFVEDEANTVNFYKIFHNDQTTEKLAFSTTWSLQTVNGQELVRVSLPIALVAYGAEIDDLEIFYTVAEGLVRRGNVEKAGMPTFYLFNQQAIQDIGAALDRDTCDVEEIQETFTEQEFVNFFNACNYISAQQAFPDLYEERIVRVRGSDGTTRAYEFNQDGSVNFYKAGLLSGELSYSLTDQDFIKLMYSENDYDLVVIVEAFDEVDEVSVAVFSNEADIGTEAWYYKGKVFERNAGVDYCTTGDSDWDDENEVPFEGTEKVFSDYVDAVAECIETIGGRSAKFGADSLMGNALVASDDDEEAYYIFGDTESSNAGWYNGELRELVEEFSVPMEWQVSEDGELNLRLNAEALFGLTVEETTTIIATDGVEMALKIFAQQSTWAEDFPYMSEDEGEVWTDIRTLIRASDVPALP